MGTSWALDKITVAVTVNFIYRESLQPLLDYHVLTPRMHDIPICIPPTQRSTGHCDLEGEMGEDRKKERRR